VSPTEILVIAFLSFAVLMQLSSVLGILVGADVYARLHFTGPASTFTPIAIAVAVVIHFGPFTQAGIKAAMVAVLIVLLGPALVHATARAARIRQKGQLE
jgi:multisubunit Na+/H+ antiporter MnhG subunit